MLPNLYASDDELLFGLGHDVLEDLRKDAETAGAMDYAFDVINEVCRMADGYLAVRYAVPITAESGIAVLRPHVVNMSRWLFLSRRCSGKYATEDARTLYDEGKEYMKALAAGTYALPGVATLADTAATVAGTSSWRSNEVEFTVGERRGF